MPVILPNGDLCEDEDYYNIKFHEYDYEYDSDYDYQIEVNENRVNQDFEDPEFTQLVDMLEFRFAMTS